METTFDREFRLWYVIQRHHFSKKASGVLNKVLLRFDRAFWDTANQVHVIQRATNEEQRGELSHLMALAPVRLLLQH